MSKRPREYDAIERELDELERALSDLREGWARADAALATTMATLEHELLAHDQRVARFVATLPPALRDDLRAARLADASIHVGAAEELPARNAAHAARRTHAVTVTLAVVDDDGELRVLDVVFTRVQSARAEIEAAAGLPLAVHAAEFVDPHDLATAWRTGCATLADAQPDGAAACSTAKLALGAFATLLLVNVVELGFDRAYGDASYQIDLRTLWARMTATREIVSVDSSSEEDDDEEDEEEETY